LQIGYGLSPPIPRINGLESSVVKTSLFDLFKIGIGPSSSHTVGPMRAAGRFVQSLHDQQLLSRTSHVVTELYGSLALTGHGHGTDRAILLGLSGERPDAIDPASIDTMLAAIRSSRQLRLSGSHTIPFNESTDLVFHRDQMLPPQPDPPVAGSPAQHPNGMRFTAYNSASSILSQQIFFSVGGGFVLSAPELAAKQLADSDAASPQSPSLPVPYPFSSAATLLATAAEHHLSIPQLMLANEAALQPGASQHEKESAVRAGIARIWQAMQDCCDRGMITEGILPGGLNVRRRAPRLAARLREKAASGLASDPLAPIDWVSVYAMAVNEENAAGGRVVTAPTNGAAGVLPAVGLYYLNFIAPHASHTPDLWPASENEFAATPGQPPNADSNANAAPHLSGIDRFFLTAAAIGILYKENASISGAEVGCQGEVGVACSMAAGGIVAALNGTNDEIEHAAEIAMEHNLGMTCDPIGGLVQIPCIERNAIGAVKAVQACRMAQAETGGHKVTLDQVIETMYRTGLDMQSRYKETSLGGLALNIIEC
jgi:L-serine dehydratase